MSDLPTIHAHELNIMVLITREDKNVKIQLEGFNESEPIIHPLKFLGIPVILVCNSVSAIACF